MEDNRESKLVILDVGQAFVVKRSNLEGIAQILLGHGLDRFYAVDWPEVPCHD